jgi:putative Holliday junction resolvase
MPHFNVPGFNTGTVQTLLAGLPAGQRVIGIDPGRRRIGVALSDVGRRLASPYGTLARGKLAANASEVVAIARREGAGGLVVGYPLEDDGRMGPAAQAVRDWVRALSAATGLPAALWDETLTTAETQAALIAADVSRARRAELVDRMAAARLLQAALDNFWRQRDSDRGQGV